jgi:hypothetical protein
MSLHAEDINYSRLVMNYIENNNLMPQVYAYIMRILLHNF